MKTGLAALIALHGALHGATALANAGGGPAEASGSAALPPPSPELLTPTSRSADLPLMHPAVVLRDDEGKPVVESERPASARRTCDGCHEVAWIEAHNLHADAAAKMDAGRAGPTCFLCHLRRADAEAWGRATPAWADTATLAALELASANGQGWQWHKQPFAADGSLPATTLGLGRPSDRACGMCHGIVAEGDVPIAPTAFGQARGQGMTDTRGIVFSGRRISDSALNVAGKDGLVRPWDVHAERLVSCAACHFSPNHPAYAWAQEAPEHLRFEARRAAITEYLRRPDHRLARGMGTSGDAPSMRGCEACHDAGKSHAWLPRPERHFAALACESCHVPAAHAPALQEVDWTVLGAGHGPRVVHRGVAGDGFLTGFRPVLLPRSERGRDPRLGPANLVTSWFWTEATARGRQRMAKATLERALFDDKGHKPELVRALDRNGDGRLSEDELVLDSAARRDAVRQLLLAAGASDPEIEGEIAVYPLHHGVATGRFATRDCATCHGEDSRLREPFLLSSAVPFAARVAWVGSAAGTTVRDGDGHLTLVPAMPALHVFGYTRSGVIDGLGLLALAAALAGALAHGLLRLRARRRATRKGQA